MEAAHGVDGRADSAFHVVGEKAWRGVELGVARLERGGGQRGVLVARGRVDEGCIAARLHVGDDVRGAVEIGREVGLGAVEERGARVGVEIGEPMDGEGGGHGGWFGLWKKGAARADNRWRVGELKGGGSWVSLRSSSLLPSREEKSFERSHRWPPDTS